MQMNWISQLPHWLHIYSGFLSEETKTFHVPFHINIISPTVYGDAVTNIMEEN